LIETIRLEKGITQNISWHQDRYEHSFSECWGMKAPHTLDLLIQCPPELRIGVTRCRISYSPGMTLVEYEAYQAKSPSSFQLVYSDEIDYRFKFSDRAALDELFKWRKGADDIIIVKKGLITDSYYANLVFTEGKGLYTPDTPLLKGTRRQQYLDHGIISTRQIRTEDLSDFSHFRLINAMISLEEGPWIPVSNIIW